MTTQMRKPPEPAQRGDFRATYKEIVPMDIEFKNPPTGKHDGHNEDVAAALKQRPGEWALVKSGVTPSNATNIKRGVVAAFRPAGSFEAVSRVNPEGGSDIYARYVGDA